MDAATVGEMVGEVRLSASVLHAAWTVNASRTNVGTGNAQMVP